MKWFVRPIPVAAWVVKVNDLKVASFKLQVADGKLQVAGGKSSATCHLQPAT